MHIIRILLGAGFLLALVPIRTKAYDFGRHEEVYYEYDDQSYGGYEDQGYGSQYQGYQNQESGLQGYYPQFGSYGTQDGYQNGGNAQYATETGYDTGYAYDNRHGGRVGNGARSGYGNSYSIHDGRHGNSNYETRTQYVPVVLKHKKKKKSVMLSVHRGQFVNGGTQIFGKFNDLVSCQKACELTPSCFAGDFNPWLKKCYHHGNVTACMQMSSHPQITHFKKVPCSVPNTPRGRVTLGTNAFNGIQLPYVNRLDECIKKCATMGGGIASTFNTIPSTPQICFALDFDFANNQCYVHIHTTSADGAVPKGYQAFCPKTGAVGTPAVLTPNQYSINIVMCPRA